MVDASTDSTCQRTSVPKEERRATRSGGMEQSDRRSGTRRAALAAAIRPQQETTYDAERHAARGLFTDLLNPVDSGPAQR